MPVYRVEIRRQVSRVVELTQISYVAIEADDQATAKDAAWAISQDHELIEEHGTEWQELDGSRHASNDEEVERPKPQWYAEEIKAGPNRVVVANAILGIED